MGIPAHGFTARQAIVDSALAGDGGGRRPAYRPGGGPGPQPAGQGRGGGYGRRGQRLLSGEAMPTRPQVRPAKAALRRRQCASLWGASPKALGCLVAAAALVLTLGRRRWRPPQGAAPNSTGPPA